MTIWGGRELLTKPSALLFALVLLVLPGQSRSDPAPVSHESVDAASHYSGQWLEIARSPVFITRNCVAANTDYSPRVDGGVDALNARYRNGKRGQIAGRAEILDPGPTPGSR